MNASSFKFVALEIGRQILRTYLTLLKIMVPILLVVRVLDLAGGTQVLARLLEPVMSFVGLPGSMALVWASTILGNIYAGMAVFVNLYPEGLTLAQVSTAGILMLLAHNLPIEGEIARKAGIPWRYTLVLRIGGALVLGSLCFIITQSLPGWNQPATLAWTAPLQNPDWGEWLLTQLKMLLLILVVISILIAGLRLLRLLGIERILHALLAPLLKIVGIGREATTITLIGSTLGLAFGGALLIDEVNSGRVNRRDIVLAISFLGLCHSLIEDTLLILLLGCSLWVVLGARLLFALIVVFLLSKILAVEPGEKTIDPL